MNDERIKKIEQELEVLKSSNEKLIKENEHLKSEILRVEAGKYECIDSILNELNKNKDKSIIKTSLGLLFAMLVCLAIAFITEGKNSTFFAASVIGTLCFLCGFIYFFAWDLNILFNKLENRGK